MSYTPEHSGEEATLKSERQLAEPSVKENLAIVLSTGVHELNTKTPLTEYLRQILDRREFILADARSRALRSTQDFRFWRFWLIVTPLINAAMYGLLFGILLNTSRGIDNFIGFVVIGTTFFGFLTALMNSGRTIIRSSKGFMQAFAFPRAALVLSQSLRLFYDSLPPAIIAILVGLCAQWGKFPGWTILLIVPLFLLLHLFGTGIALVVARVAAFFPDISAILRFFTRAWFYTSGIFFSVDRWVNHPVIAEIMEANPAYIFLQALRGAALYGVPPSVEDWGKMLIWSLGFFIFGLVFFWRAEQRYVNVR